jgi:hypothetical protein
MSLSDNALAAIAKGKTAQFVADAYGLSRREVVREAQAAGYQHDPTSDYFRAAAAVRPVTGVAGSRTPGTTVSPAPPVVPVRPAARDLLSEAAELAPGSKKIGRALAKANEALKALNDVVIEDRATAELRGEEQRLADELRRVREQLRGGSKTSTSTTSGATPKQIREWAAANDIECPARGKVPNSVREAYDAAQADAA